MVLNRFWLWIPLLVGNSAWSADFVAGVAPHRRPLNAPVVATYTVPADTLTTYLHGVEKPVPPNVRQAVESGAWFMPLRHPGMTAPYDLRGHHAPKNNR